MTEERKHAIFRAGVSTSSHLSGKPTNRELARELWATGKNAKLQSLL